MGGTDYQPTGRRVSVVVESSVAVTSVAQATPSSVRTIRLSRASSGSEVEGVESGTITVTPTPSRGVRLGPGYDKA